MIDRPELNQSYLFYNWPDKPENVNLCTTLKTGGMSKDDFASFNLATHVGDDLASVSSNRQKLASDLGLSSEPLWLNQVHSDEVLTIDDHIEAHSSGYDSLVSPTADACISLSLIHISEPTRL